MEKGRKSMDALPETKRFDTFQHRYGVVYKGRDRESGNTVAIKKVRVTFA